MVDEDRRQLSEIVDGLAEKEVYDMEDEYAQAMDGKLDHLAYDTDAIIKMLSGDKMSESFDSGLLTGLAQKSGMDPSTMAMLMNNNNFGGNGWVFFLFLILLGRNGWGGWDGNDYAKESTVLNQNNFNTLMNAINSTGTKQEMAIQNLANALGADYNSVALSLASIDKELATAKGDIKSAIQACCCTVRQEIASASAKTDLGIERASAANQLAIERTSSATQHEIERASAMEQLENEKQTRAIIDAIQNQNVLGMQQTQEILRQMQAYQIENDHHFCDLKEREYQHIIEDLKARLHDQSQSAQTAQILAAVAAPRYSVTSGTYNADTNTYSGSGTVRL